MFFSKKIYLQTYVWIVNGDNKKSFRLEVGKYSFSITTNRKVNELNDLRDHVPGN